MPMSIILLCVHVETKVCLFEDEHRDIDYYSGAGGGGWDDNGDDDDDNDDGCSESNESFW